MAGSVRTRWGAEHVAPPSDDPFAETAEKVGQRVDLGDLDRVTDALEDVSRAARRMGEVQTAGYTCAIRDNPETCCTACPISQHADDDGPIAPLCAASRELERVLTAYAVEVERGR